MGFENELGVWGFFWLNDLIYFIGIFEGLVNINIIDEFVMCGEFYY